MQNSIYDQLFGQGLISENTLKRVKQAHSTTLFSLHWELKVILYFGIMLLSAGLGILIYKNIDSISHQLVLTVIAAICIGCFTWCNKHKKPFSYDKVQTHDSFTDYILLLGTLSFLTFVGYLQYQFEVFGTHYGMATFIPMMVLFFIAYYFDHLGILTMAIANLGIWMGISVTPKHLLSNGTFNNETVIYTYLILGLILMAAAYLTMYFHIKKHFFFSYYHYSVHLIYISLLAGYFYYNYGVSLIWLAAFALAAWYIYMDAMKRKSFYFLLLTVIYSYIAISGFCIRTLMFIEDSGVLYIGFIYFIASGILFINILMNLNKKLKGL
ncbi:MAG TPA: DUF2157 domain-containing protein [Sphingobacteriaceae bacterium]